MKKILASLAVFLAAINIMAQEHLSFKGIPIEGSMTRVLSKTKNQRIYFYRAGKQYLFVYRGFYWP